MSDMCFITADDLAVGYKTPLIEHICFQVREGEILSLIGPNGSGKSTVLKTVAGYLRKHGGTVLIENTKDDCLSPNEKAKKMSVLLTERLRSDRMTCREVVETGRYPYTGHFGLLGAEDRRAVDEAVELVKMSDYQNADFGEISDGQRQRVLLAKAICQEPRVLILDEPTSYLDICHKILFLEILKKLAAEKQLAVILSMHELDFAEKISDYTVCIKNGAVFCSGPPADIFTPDTVCRLFDIPKELYAQYFLSSHR